MAQSTLGIIAEYNPFHNGHAYQLRAAQAKSRADLTIVVMSGNWMQRGEPALLDKWQRAKLALAAGVDLVVELPFQFAVQPAHLFAAGAVQILAALGCETLAFGAEHPELDFAKLAAHQPIAEKSHFKQFDETYPTLFNDYLQEQTGLNLRASNDILGFTYVVANQQLAQPMTMLPIQRQTSDHQAETVADDARIASGAAIRAAIANGQWSTVERIVPPTTYQALQAETLLSWDTYWPYLRYQLVSQPIEQLQRLYQMSEGIEYRLKRSAMQATSFADFLRLAKTKRFTYARLQRLCVYVLMQVTQDQLPTTLRYIRVLGFNQRGQRHLNQVKKTAPVPLITRVTDDWLTGPYALDGQAGELRQLVTGINQDQLQHPIRLEN
ncbi:nucleotidyltransferase [Secundilactobacillus muriivasis]